MFLQRESIYSYILAIGSVCVYYGVSFIMGNISLTGGTIISVLVYMPWTILQGGLEECGWRGYLQPKFNIKSYILKMFLISIVWFLWHIPIYRLPWITVGSSVSEKSFPQSSRPTLRDISPEFSCRSPKC